MKKKLWEKSSSNNYLIFNSSKYLLQFKLKLRFHKNILIYNDYQDVFFIKIVG